MDLVDSSDGDSDQESAADDNMCIAEDLAAVEDDCYRLEEDEIANDSGFPQVHF